MADQPALRSVHATCSLDCPDSCSVLVTVRAATADEPERAIKVEGDPAHPVTRGFLCGKVAKYLDRVYAPDRVLYPMRRRTAVAKGALVRGREEETFERISWDEALTTISARLTEVVKESGPESVLPYSYAGTIGQLGYGSMDRRFFHRLGASQLDRTICAAAGGEALKRVYGVKMGTQPQDFANAGLIIAWGANVHGNNIHLWPFIEEARRKGARLIVIDPYRTRTAALADEYLQINPGTDGLLALSMMHVIFSGGLEDRAYLDECTHGAAELRAHALKACHAPEVAAGVTGIAAETIVRLANDYAEAARGDSRPAVIRLNYGVQRSENGGTAARAVLMLPLITGSWKKLGGGVLLSMSGAFAFNGARLEMPELMLKSPLGRPSRVINMNQLGAVLNGSVDPPVKALFVYNSNPAAVAPNQNAVLEGMRREDLFTVVHDQFFTDTADYADILLPAPTFLETKDVQGAYGHRFVQMNDRAIEPRGEVRNNVRVFAELARQMGFEDGCFDDREDELIDQALDSAAPSMQGITRAKLEAEGRVPLAMRADAAGHVLPFSSADWFRTASGKGELVPVPEFEAPLESRTRQGDYPLEFLPRKADNYMNSTFANQVVHQKMEAAKAGVIEMHPEDAGERGLQAGDAADVFNDRGLIRLRVQMNGKVGRGVVAASLDWSKLQRDLSGHAANVNALTSERLTDIGGGATFYSTLCEVRKAEVH